MATTCKNYYGKIFAHLAGGLAVSAASAEFSDIGQDFLSDSILLQFLANFAILLGLMIVLFKTTPGGIPKYAAFAAFAFWIGQTIKPYWNRLQDRGELTRVLIMTTGIFLGMMAIGFYDNQNLLGFGPYLFGGLLGLILAQLVVYALGTPEEKKKAFSAFRFFGIALFAAYTAYDVQLLKARKSVCAIGVSKKLKPDYPVESLGLYLDFVNLFLKVGGRD